MTGSWAVILPSRDEAATIAGVAVAADLAIHDQQAMLINVDHSVDEATKRAFLSAPLVARRHYVRTSRLGKGLQVEEGLSLARELGFRRVLMLDTDVRNPSVLINGALVRAVEAGHELAVPQYRRMWYEGNLTNHVARPLIAATLGVDLAQPLAGDFAFSATILDDVLARRARLAGTRLASCVDGYGIDAFIVLAAILNGHSVCSVRIPELKQHAPSFPHFPRIYHDVVPVLLDGCALGFDRHPAGFAGGFQLEPGRLPPDTFREMQNGLTAMSSGSGVCPDPSRWTTDLLTAWRHVCRGSDPLIAACELWPRYVDRVKQYLAEGQARGVTSAAEFLEKAAAELIVAATAALELEHSDGYFAF